MEQLTINEIKEQLLHITDCEDPFLQRLATDKRKGAQSLLLKWHKQYEQKKKEEEKFYQMSLYEQEGRAAGYKLICGIDEVGRGPLAGPVVAAAVILPESFYLVGIDDSKKLSEEKREHYFEAIQKQALGIGIGIIESEEIDAINIYEATKKAMLAAVEQLTVKPDYLLIDAMKLNTPIPTQSIIKGDANSISIAAASIIAKVTRDRLMKKLAIDYPAYHFSKNMGYGTKEHLLAIELYGITPHHRKSFAPIKDQRL